MHSADKDANGSSEDKWSFDGTVRHLPQGVVPGENGPVPSISSLTPPEQQQQPLSIPPPSLSSTEQPAQQQNNHIEQVRIVIFAMPQV